MKKILHKFNVKKTAAALFTLAVSLTTFAADFTVYSKGKTGSYVNFYTWTNISQNINADSPGGNEKVFSVEANNNGSGFSGGFEIAAGTYRFANATLTFKYYATEPCSFQIRLNNSLDGDRKKEQNSQTISVTAEDINKWKDVTLNISDVFPEVSSAWAINDNSGKGYIFGINVWGNSGAGTLYFSDIVYKNIKELGYETPEGFDIYFEGKLTSGIDVNHWWNDSEQWDADNPYMDGSKVWKFGQNNQSLKTFSTALFTQENNDFIGKLADGTLYFEYYPTETGTYYLELQCGDAIKGTYDFKIEETELHKWSQKRFKIKDIEVFEKVAEAWESYENNGKGCIFSVKVEKFENQGTIYINNIKYLDINEEWKKPSEDREDNSDLIVKNLEINNLYLIGSLSYYHSPWDDKNSIEAKKIGDGVFKFSNIVFDTDFNRSNSEWPNITTGESSDEWRAKKDNYFQILVNNKNWDYRFCPNVSFKENALLDSDNLSSNIVLLKNYNQDDEKGEGFSSFQVYNGVYDITVDLNTNTLSVEKVNYTAMENLLNFKMSFWEGPIFNLIGGEEQVFSFYGTDEKGRWIYWINVTDGEIAPIEYVSQMFIGGQIKNIHETNAYNYTLDENGNISREYFDISDMSSYFEWKTYYFDAHQTGYNIPLLKEFWCGNSRMEVGMTVKAIYLIYDPEIAKSRSETTPFDIYLSSNGELDYDAQDQPDMNNDSYALRLTSGPLFDALKGSTNSSSVVIPFAKHHLADEGYVISFGKYIDLSEEETFSLMIKEGSKSNYEFANVKFDVNSLNSFLDSSYGNYSTISTNGKINKIILMVENSKDHNGSGMYDVYRLWFVGDGTEGDKRPDNFDKYLTRYNYKEQEDEENYPKLKIWSGGNSSWNELFSSQEVKADSEDGSARYYNFTPILGSEGHRTNIYYLDLGENGIKFGKPTYKDDITYGAQFNIMDSNGYDISNVYQGSQSIFVDQWWCANPNLTDDSDSPARTYNGFGFKDVTRFGSAVDLLWNTSNEGETIYGITLFKIMGKGYDVYANDIIERPFYYIYASTDPNSKHNYETSCPILLEVDGEISDAAVYSFESNKNLSPLSETGKNYYTLIKSPKTISSNDDINYTLVTSNGEDRLTIQPGNMKFEFVDVNGDQRWSASSGDKMIANTWTNYYSSNDVSDDNTLEFNNKNADFFRLVLATNPDQVRYQAMSYFAGIVAEPYFLYKDLNDVDGENYHNIIYPVAKLTGKFVWRGSPLNISIRNGNIDEDAQFDSFEVDESDIDDNMKLSISDDGFWEDGEYPFDYELGTYFIDPDKHTAKVVETSGDFTNESGTVDFSEMLIAPELNNLKVEETYYSPGPNSNYYFGVYAAKLTWNNIYHEQHPGLPRTYQFYGEEVTDKGYKSGEDVMSEELPIVYNTAYNHNKSLEIPEGEQNFGGYVIGIDGNRLMDGDKKAYGFRVESIHTYAVPTSENPLTFNDGTKRNARAQINDLDENLFESYNSDLFTSVEKKSATSYAYGEYTQTTPTGVENIDVEQELPVEYYTLQGMRIENPASGTIVIRKQGASVSKILVK